MHGHAASFGRRPAAVTGIKDDGYQDHGDALADAQHVCGSIVCRNRSRDSRGKLISTNMRTALIYLPSRVSNTVKRLSKNPKVSRNNDGPIAEAVDKVRTRILESRSETSV